MINQEWILIIIGGLMAGFLFFLIIQVLLMRSKLNRLYKKYKYFMAGADGDSLERRLSAEVMEIRELLSSSESVLHQQELLATMQLQSFQKIGLVRYDAFDDTGDELSFSLAILDGRNNGYLLSSLAGQDSSRIYAKRIMGGQCKEALSSEEAESLTRAMNTAMPRIALEEENRKEKEKVTDAKTGT